MASLPHKLDITATGNERQFLVSDLCQMLEQYLNSKEVANIYSAYLFGAEAHLHQTRLSGEPYIYHPLAVAQIMAELRMDAVTISASLLHDVIEDTGVSKAELAEKFGEAVASVVDGVSKIERFAFEKKETRQAKNFQKMLLAVAKDIRVVLVKLGDRLHNMRTIEYMLLPKQKIIAKETMEIYAPLAQRLGMDSLMIELEDLAFKVLYPMRYRVLKNEIEVRMQQKGKQFNQLIEQVSAHCASVALECQVQGRKKHLYGIYRKMKEKQQPFSKIADIFAMRLIVNNIEECYRTLGIMHNFAKPIPGKFKDYIALPKSNGYQSLHTILFGHKGITLEVQIRTTEMNEVAEFGIASHTAYKANDRQIKVDNTIKWIQGLTEIKDAENYMQNLKAALVPQQVYPFTPNGEIFALPKYSTALDFAFAVHTDVGMSTVRVKIDHKERPLDTVLRSGQTVEVITSSRAKPDPAWLGFVITGKARHAVHQYLKQMRYSDILNAGKRLLEQLLTKHQIDMNDIPESQIIRIARSVGEDNLDGLYYQIGMGNQMPQIIIAYLMKQHDTNQPLVLSVGSKLSDVYQLDIVRSYAKCCYPLPEDEIVAKVSGERGLIVHRSDCSNVLASDNIVQLCWVDKIDEPAGYRTIIRVVTPDKVGMLASIASQIAQYQTNIEHIEFEDRSAGTATVDFTVNLKDKNVLNQLMQQIKKGATNTEVYRLGVKKHSNERR